jgi:beta-glucanase (GH16 family)
MTANKIKTLNKLFFCLVIIIFFISCQDEKTYNLKTYIIPDNAGEILTESGVYAEGTKLILEALSKDNFTFTRWSGDIDSKTNPLNFEINSDLDIVAEFKEIIDASSKDSDNDGVSDSIDLCPSTPSGFLVDESGCKIKNEFDENYFLVWGDEFSYDGSLDNSKWHHQIIPPNNGSWWNGEAQHYTNNSKNSFVSEGTMKIVAIKENHTVNNSIKNYTSARINSKFGFKYGRVDVRAKLPSTKGTWPAIWTLGTNINEVGNYFGDSEGSVGWPKCGEIDIMEQNGWNKNELYGYFHFANSQGAYSSHGDLTNINNASGSYHIYSMEWTKDKIKILLDNKEFVSLNNTTDVPYDNPHYFLLNIAIGGSLGGDIDPSFSQDKMEVDYIRVFKKE